MELIKAIRIHNYGGSEVLQYDDAPRPKPAPGEVLIRVHAGVNPADWKVREGHLKQFVQNNLPLIPGWDVSGVVEEVGLASVVQPPDAEKAKEFGVRGAFVWTQPNGKELAEIAALIDSNNLKVVLDRILPLSEARRAHELSQSGHARGKIVLRVKED